METNSLIKGEDVYVLMYYIGRKCNLLVALKDRVRNKINRAPEATCGKATTGFTTCKYDRVSTTFQFAVFVKSTWQGALRAILHTIQKSCLLMLNSFDIEISVLSTWKM
jgi:hypothetical protein